MQTQKALKFRPLDTILYLLLSGYYIGLLSLAFSIGAMTRDSNVPQKSLGVSNNFYFGLLLVGSTLAPMLKEKLIFQNEAFFLI